MESLNRKIFLWLHPEWDCDHRWSLNEGGQIHLPTSVCEKCELPYINQPKIPDYTTDPAACLELIEAVADKTEWMFTGQNWRYYGNQSYSSVFCSTELVNREVNATADTLPMAVAKAVEKLIDSEGK